MVESKQTQSNCLDSPLGSRLVDYRRNRLDISVGGNGTFALMSEFLTLYLKSWDLAWSFSIHHLKF